MSHSIFSSPKIYTAVKVVSPMMFGDEKKDQDRARWHGPGQVACVCDGLTSSPRSDEAAEVTTNIAPGLFNGKISDRLSMLCDVLIALRKEYQQSSLVIPDETPQTMQDVLQRIVQEKRATSFQTTMVAARFAPDEKAVIVDIIRFGDSAFFAYSPDGELLTCSLNYPSGSGDYEKIPNIRTHSTFVPHKITFKPGGQILVRIEGLLSQHRGLARSAGIKDEHMENWLVCTPVDACGAGSRYHEENLSDLRGLSLQPGDRLLVPRYLYGARLTSKGKRYSILDYSSTIKPVFARMDYASVNPFGRHCAATTVLPDHFYCGCFDCFQDRFPPWTNFVLCSDGLYSSFSDAGQLWTWLRENAGALSDKNGQQSVLSQLHSILYASGGDDDISFVWVYPIK